MIGDFISRGLVMILGYAYPAFQCFKTLESNRVDNNDLRFWCQYWIIVACCQYVKRMPLYEELKLAFIIYLWSPKTRGTSYVYETLLQPLVSRHETDIDTYLTDLRLRVWDLAIYYWQNCTELGQGAFLQLIQFMLTQSQRLGRGGPAGPQDEGPRGGGSDAAKPPPQPPMDYVARPLHRTNDSPLRGIFRRKAAQPSAPPMPQSMMHQHRSLTPFPHSIRTVLLEPDEAHIQYIHYMYT